MPIRLKRGTTVPNASNLVTGEVAINTTNGFAYTKTDAGAVVQIGSTTDLSVYAPLASPALSGVPTAPTASVGTNTNQIATTNFVQSAIAGTSVTSAQTLITEVRNTTGATLTKGTVVYVSGAGANKPLAIKANAASEATSAFTLGLVQNDITNNSNGFVVTSGAITGLNTQAYTEGTLLYLSATTAGGWTATKPSAPNHIVFIGIVITSSNSQGAIEVALQNGYQLDELHDVDAILPSNDKEILAYTLSDQTWRNRTANFLGLAELGANNIFTKNQTVQGLTASTPTVTIDNQVGYVGSGELGHSLVIKNPFAPSSAIVANGFGGFGINVNPSVSQSEGLTVNGTSQFYGSSLIWGQELNSGSQFKVQPSGIIFSAQPNGSGGFSQVSPLNGTTGIRMQNADATEGVDITALDGVKVRVGSVETAYKNTGIVFSDGSTQTTAYTGGTVTIPQVITNVLASTQPALRITNEATNSAAHSLVVEDVTNPDITSFIVNNSGNVGIGVNPASWTPSNKVEIVGSLSTTAGRATFTPTNTNTPSVNLGATSISSSPTSAVNGDIWITNATSPKLGYKTGGVNYYPAVANQFNTFTGGMAITGASSTQAQLQITQSGSSPALQVTSVGQGNALVVEDSTSTDSDAFIINANGNVGVGVASGWTPVGKMDVNGTITATTPAVGTNSTLVATTEFVKTAMHPQVVTLSDGQYAPNSTTAWQVIFRLNLTSDASIQLPTNAYTQAIGAQYVYLQMGTGRLDFTPTNGNTVMSAGGKYWSVEQYSVITAIKTGANEWLIAGDLSAS